MSDDDDDDGGGGGADMLIMGGWLRLVSQFLIDKTIFP
jgi:hypothetical protein